MRPPRKSKLLPYLSLIIGVLATLCAYLALYLVRNAIAIKSITEYAFEFPAFVLNLPLVFFIAGGISTIVLLVWPRGPQAK